MINEEVLEPIFSACKMVNNQILNQYNEDEYKLTFVDHYMFQNSSYLLSIINRYLYGHRNKSVSTFFLFRCVIENIAVLEMNEAGDIPKDCEELLKDYNYLIEYDIYKKYQELHSVSFDFEDVKKNYENTKEKYKDSITDKSGRDFKDLLRSKLPWLKQEYKFEELISTYCENLLDYYKYFSFVIHPNEISMLKFTIDKQDLDGLFVAISSYFMKIFAKYYSKGQYLKPNENIYFEKKFIAENPLNAKYMGHVLVQCDCLEKIGKLILKYFPKDTNSLYYLEYKSIVYDMALDKTFGYNECVKSLVKPFLELAVMHDYLIMTTIKPKDEYKRKLLYDYSHINYNRLFDYPMDEAYEEGYKLYCENIKNVSKEEFDKEFIIGLGFLNPKTSITKFVNTFVDKLFNESISDFELQRATMKINYDESQALSYANGYMISANSGSFGDFLPVITETDFVIQHLTEKYITKVELLVSITEDKKYNKLIYDLNKELKMYKRAGQGRIKMDMLLKDKKVNNM